LVFEPNDNFKAKLTFSRDAVDDGPRGDFYAGPESSFDCYNSLNLIQVGVTMASNLRVDGLNECELDVHPETVLEQLNDYARYFGNNPDHLTSIADDLRAQGAVDGHLGLTVEEQALIVYDGYSVRHGLAGSESERNRVTAQFDYLFDNGSGLQFSVMNSEEDLFRGYSRVAEQEVQSVDWNAGAGIYDNYAPMNGRRVPDNSPTTIEENYLEVRWASPGEDRLRYVVGASYYDYEYIYTDFGTPGFSNIASGTADLFEQLTGFTVGPSTIQSEVTTNTALFFNASYDFSDTLTGSIEGRFATDEVGAVLPLSGLEDFVTTESFTPRIALNWSPNDSTTYYAQYSVGVNPAGLNATMLDPLTRATLDNGVPVDDTIYGGSINENITSVNYDSSRYSSFEEEELVNYEIGVKGNAFDGNFTYAGAIYFMEWDSALENIALNWDYTYADDDLAGTLVTDDDPTGPAGVYYVPETDNTSVNNVLTNTGVSDTMGIELQASYQINDRWSISGNASVMQREFTDYCSEDDFLGYPNERGVYAGLALGSSEGGNPCWVLDGLEVADQPTVAITLIPRYRTVLGDSFRFTASLQLRHTGQHFSEFSNTTEFPAVNRVNLRLGLAKNAWSGSLYIDNLLDEGNMVPRGATSLNRFNQLNAPATIPPEYQFDFQGGPWASFRFNPNVGISAGLRFNYDF
jgi:outer membrane receptor protein involved in Fe transport